MIKGLNRRMAANWLIQHSYRRGIFDPARSRGRGAWRDEGRVIFRFGDALSIDGTMTDVTKVKSRFIYEMMHALRHPADEALSDVDASKVLDVAEMMRWKRAASAPLLAGWVALAVASARWRVAS